MNIKIDGLKHNKYYTKVNMNNQVVMGVGMFLTDEEYELLLKSNLILIEGFFAIRKLRNMYGIAIQLEKNGSEVEPKFANTYKVNGIGNINNLAH